MYSASMQTVRFLRDAATKINRLRFVSRSRFRSRSYSHFRSRVRSSARSSRLFIVIGTAFFRSVNIGLDGT